MEVYTQLNSTNINTQWIYNGVDMFSHLVYKYGLRYSSTAKTVLAAILRHTLFSSDGLN